jgi:hypothetical protein
MDDKARKASVPGPAVADEDPDRSPMDGLATGLGPAQPMDVDEVEKDRAKSTGPRTDELRKPQSR